jgi:glucose/arabinose dehydrogenase
MDITGRVRDTGNEEGLLSLAFHPDYESNGFFYVYYVNNSGDLTISRFSVTGDPNVGDDTSENEIITIPHPTNSNHNGGQLTFGPDGFLYAAIGDGGSGCDPNENSQNDALRLGKLLRIEVATETVTTWAKGLRNPWRFSFDRLTGDLYIADVGQNSWEEVNFVAAPAPPPASPTSGLNYGWDFYEARHCSAAAAPEGSSCGDPCPMPPTGLTMPVLEYNHGQGCSITGGFAYRGCTMPDLQGRYFYSDACTAFIRSFLGVSSGDAQNLQDNTADLAPGGGLNIGGVSSFGEDARGELYITDLGGGEVFKVVPE